MIEQHAQKKKIDIDISQKELNNLNLKLLKELYGEKYDIKSRKNLCIKCHKNFYQKK
jgi:hypothetical protein